MTAGRKVITDKKDWGTPPKYVAAVRQAFGGKIHLDPCSSPFSVVSADVEYRLPQQDGLIESWDYPTIYVNPPYGNDIERGTRIANWIRRCEESYRLYDSEVIALIPVATNTGHWKNYVFGKATAVCFLYDTRLRFLVDGRDEGKGAPMSCATVYWGQNYARFFDAFIGFGAVLQLENLKEVEVGKAQSYRRQSSTNSLSREIDARQIELFPYGDSAD